MKSEIFFVAMLLTNYSQSYVKGQMNTIFYILRDGVKKPFFWNMVKKGWEGSYQNQTKNKSQFLNFDFREGGFSHKFQTHLKPKSVYL